MKVKIKGIFITLLTGMVLLLSITGCGRIEEETQETSVSENTKASEETEAQEEETLSVAKEIPIDFPCMGVLKLAQPAESLGEYELRLYDEGGEIVQKLPCGILKEPVQFSFDYLLYGDPKCLEIFPADSDTGLLFCWDWENDKFLEHSIEIPKYEETCRSGMVVVEEDDTYQIKKIYQVNQPQECVDEVRRWTLKKDTGELQIWDCLEKVNLFKGTVLLNEEKNPANKEYYDMLFQDERYILLDWFSQEEYPLQVWIDEPRPENEEAPPGIDGFEYVQRELFDNNGHTAEYENKEPFLSDFGMENCVPMYRYYDQFHNVQLELYEYENTGKYLGIYYSYYFNDEKKKGVRTYGFFINTITEAEWTGKDTFSTKSVYGSDVATDLADESPEETIEYTSFGKPDYYCCKRIVEWEEGGELKEDLFTALEINFIYRDDGTLFCKDYWHDGSLYSTTLSSLESFYDEKERVVYENGYITHGELEYYYIYEDAGNVPAYCLIIDHNLGYPIPDMIRYQ